MIKVVLDANQFVSALLKRDSNPAKILQLVQANCIQLLMSEAIIAEIDAVLRYPKIRARHGKDNNFIDLFLKRLRSIATLTAGAMEINHITDDPDDNRYLECALEGSADFIVSGDHHLTNLKTIQGIPIVTPQAFLVIIQDKL